jgi:MFS family permease
VASWSLAIIGLANVVGSLFAGAWISRYRSKHVLAAMYASRAVLIAAYLLMPRTEAVYYLFAAGLGFTWLATVPPTASLVGKLFGIRYLATLFGLTLLSPPDRRIPRRLAGAGWRSAISETSPGCGMPTWRWRPSPRWSICRSGRHG